MDRRLLVTFGAYDANGKPGHLGLAEARHQAVEIINRVKRGEPALPQARPSKEHLALTFEKLALEYIDEIKGDQPSWGWKLQLLKAHVFPRWKDRTAESITPGDVKSLMKSIKEKGSPVSMNRVHSIVRTIFYWAMESDDSGEMFATNPAARIKKLRYRETPKSRFLSEGEIARFWNALTAVIDNEIEYRSAVVERRADRTSYRLKSTLVRPSHSLSAISALALQLCLVTGQRPGQVAGFANTERYDGEWVLPADRTKRGTAHVVPLTGLAIDILDKAELITTLIDRQCDFEPSYYFPTRVLRDELISRKSLEKAMGRLLECIGMRKAGPHDLRRTCNTNLAKLQVRREIRDHVMNHASTGTNARHYDVHDYIVEKRSALQQWEQRLREIVDGVSSDTEAA